jgi:hypothetical protein
MFQKWPVPEYSPVSLTIFPTYENTKKYVGASYLHITYGRGPVLFDEPNISLVSSFLAFDDGYNY